MIAFLAAAVLVAGPTEEERLRGAFFGSLVADALCLGSHYEYDAASIKRAYGGKIIDELLGPGEKMGGSTHGVGCEFDPLARATHAQCVTTPETEL